MSAPLKVVIVGGHGKVALHLAKFLTEASHHVTSIIRDASHSSDIEARGAKPLVLSLEDSPVSDFTAAFQDASVVYFSAGAGGKGGEERTRKVDYEGAVKVFDAIDGINREQRPRLILVSALEVRDPSKIPEHYSEEDKKMVERIRPFLGTYLKWKYEADKNLKARTKFQWTILRPGGLTDEPVTGKAVVGKVHLSGTICRADVAKALFLLLERKDADKLGIDITGGDKAEDIGAGLDEFIKKGVSDFLG